MCEGFVCLFRCFTCILQESGQRIQVLYDSTEKYRKTVGSVITKMFVRRFPDGLSSVSTDDLLSWELWPVCISIHSKFYATVAYSYIPCTQA
jgi:hypothetical protein